MAETKFSRGNIKNAHLIFLNLKFFKNFKSFFGGFFRVNTLKNNANYKIN